MHARVCMSACTCVCVCVRAHCVCVCVCVCACVTEHIIFHILRSLPQGRVERCGQDCMLKCVFVCVHMVFAYSFESM